VAAYQRVPDLRQQIIASPCLHPRGAGAVAHPGVFVTNADVDPIAGLLTLREQHPFCWLAAGRP
jgi:pyrroloquinoline quinone biosynthesis protein B